MFLSHVRLFIREFARTSGGILLILSNIPLRSELTLGEENLLLVLRALHVQAIAIQVTAKVLGWWKGDTLVAFLPWKFTTWNFDKMIENGIRINMLPWHLKTCHFPEYVQIFNSI